MTASNQQKTETKSRELSEKELSKASGGIIAVLRPVAQTCDGSVRPVDQQSQRGIIAV